MNVNIPNFKQVALVFMATSLLSTYACKNINESDIKTAEKKATVDVDEKLEAFKLDYAISLYASSLSNHNAKVVESQDQKLNEREVGQIARDYLAAWDTHDFESIRQKLTPLFSPTGTYSDPGETARGIDTLTHVITGMHRNLKGLIRVFKILGEPKLIQNAGGLFHNVDNVCIYNWSWRQDGKHVLPGKNLTQFTDDQMIKFDMGIFSTESFPHFKHLPEAVRSKMENSAAKYIEKLNALSGEEKYQLIERALNHSVNANGNHTALLTKLKSKQLDKAVFKKIGKASFTRISIAYPWTMSLDGEVLLKGTEVNIFDEADNIEQAYGFSGN